MVAGNVERCSAFIYHSVHFVVLPHSRKVYPVEHLYGYRVMTNNQLKLIGDDNKMTPIQTIAHLKERHYQLKQLEKYRQT